jgi:endonuclease-3
MTAETIALEDWEGPRADRVRRIRDRLRQLYGIPDAEPHGHPIAELILTVLSQSTNDRNRDVAYFGLRERFSGPARARRPASPDSAGPEPSGYWESVRDAPVDAVEEAIRPAGISKVKSARIRSILAAIAEPDDVRAAQSDEAGRRVGGRRTGEPSLQWLAGVPVGEAQDYLCSLPGVGRKTAACVLLFALGMRDVPVDTHVSRVGMRLHLLRPGAAFEELHDAMLALTPPGEELELHINLLRHGRRTCHARRPACGDCALARMCPSAARFG